MRALSRNRLLNHQLETLEPREVPAGLLGNLNSLGKSAEVEPLGMTLSPTTKTGAFFLANRGSESGLWKTDGTASGALFLGVKPAESTSVNPTVIGEKVFFFNSDSKTGVELWTSDGTKAGTKLVKDLVPGATGLNPTAGIELNGRFLFASDLSGSGQKPQLCVSDGTAAGTQAIATLPTTDGSGFLKAGKYAYYSANVTNPNDGTVRSTLYRTDGTKAGTSVFAKLPADTSVSGVFPWGGGDWGGMVGNKFVFMATSRNLGRELWISDGTQVGTKLLKDINPKKTSVGGNSSDPHDFKLLGNQLYFKADDGVHGKEMWRTDGTAAGTKMFIDLSPSVGSITTSEPTHYLFPTLDLSSFLSLSSVINGKLYFSGNNGATGDQLYVTDGTTAGTKPLTSVTHSSTTPGTFLNEFPYLIGSLGNKILFSIGTKTDGRQLWITDGTKANTSMVKKIGGPSSLVSSWEMGPAGLGVIKGKLVFSANDGATGRQIWETDGTSAGTKMVQKLTTGTDGSAPRSFIAAGSKSVFLADDTYRSTTVYVTDGVGKPVVLKRFVRPDENAPSFTTPEIETPAQLTYLNGKTYFVTQREAFGRQLWSSDGTSAGTKMIKEFSLPKTFSLSNFNAPLGIDNLTAFQGSVYFTSDVPGVGQQLWKTDGTSAGTKLVKLISTNSTSSYSFGETMGPVRELTVVRNTLFFVANNGTHGEELWVSDGTSAGTKLLKDINAPISKDPFTQNLSSAPQNLTVLNGKLYFIAVADPMKGRQLMVSDGTNAGTKVVASIYADPVTFPTSSAYVPGETRKRMMTAANGKLFFWGQDRTNGNQLWTSEGTAGSTKRITGVSKLPKDAMVENMRTVGKKVYFTVYTTALGKQLWVSDGTDAGTRLTKAIGDGKLVPAETSPFIAGGANPTIIATVGDKVYFTANDPAKGRELFVTDGTTAGTKLIKEFQTGSGGSIGDPAAQNNSAAVLGNMLILGIDDGTQGLEPWSISLSDLK